MLLYLATAVGYDNWYNNSFFVSITKMTPKNNQTPYNKFVMVFSGWKYK